MGNIAFFHEKFPAGGAETVTFDIASILKDKVNDIYVFAHELHIEKFPEHSQNIKPIKLPFPNNNEQNYPIVLSKIKELGIEILILPSINYFPFIDRIKQDAGVKVVHVLHSTPFWEYKSGFSKAKRRANGSFLKRLEWYFLRLPKYKFGFKYNSLKKRYMDTYNKVDIYGVLSEGFGIELAERLGIEYSTSKIRVLSNYVKELSDVNEKKKNEVYFIGRFTYDDKRVDRLLKIWSLVEKENPNWSLNLVGSGQEEVNLIRLKEKLELQRVSFLGYTTSPKEYYDRASIVCLTSTFEGWPMALLEAQSNQCATIAFDCSTGIRDILSPSWENGVLVEPYNIKAYANALSKLMRDAELRNRIAKNGKSAVKRFSSENTLKQWICLLKELS